MLKILIVEDDSQLATTLKYLVEDNPRYRVVAIADDADNAVAAAEHHNPDLALVDLALGAWKHRLFSRGAPQRLMTCRACSSAARRRAFRCPTSLSAA